jgi:thioredoxin reductase (NADPH)
LAKSLIVTTGTERRKLNVDGEKEYLGKGVSYCTNCDIPFFKNKIVTLVGGSNSACSGASHAAEFASKVFLIYRKDELRAEPVWIEDIKNNPKIEVIYNTNITKILSGREIREMGESREIREDQLDKVAGVELDNEYNGSKILPLDGVFVEIGGVPASSFLIPLGVEMDENGYVKVNEKMETNIAGLFAGGDFTTTSLFLQQTITACADGAKAGYSVFNYLKKRGK